MNWSTLYRTVSHADESGVLGGMYTSKQSKATSCVARATCGDQELRAVNVVVQECHPTGSIDDKKVIERDEPTSLARARVLRRQPLVPIKIEV